MCLMLSPPDLSPPPCTDSYETTLGGGGGGEERGGEILHKLDEVNQHMHSVKPLPSIKPKFLKGRGGGGGVHYCSKL